MQGTPKDAENFPFVVLGNKCDKANERKVDTIKAKQWCKKNKDLQYFETSAQENTNIEEAFTSIARAAASHDSEEM